MVDLKEEDLDNVEQSLKSFFEQFDLQDPTSIIVLEQLFKMLCGK